MTSRKVLVYVGDHAQVLAGSGRSVVHGDVVDPSELLLTKGDEYGEDQYLIDDGRIIEPPPNEQATAAKEGGE